MDKETARRIKKASAYDSIEDKYYQDGNSPDQIKLLREILNEFAESRGLKFAEVFSNQDRQLRYV